MRVIELTKGRVAIVDDSDFLELAQYRWRFDARGYACRWSPMVNSRRYVILMHVVILNPPAGFDVDHKNGNGLDNRRENLRVATRSQNQWNRRVNKNSKTGFKGVEWHKRNAKFYSRIMKDGKSIWLGYFDTPEQASNAYDIATVRLHGEFSRPNQAR